MEMKTARELMALMLAEVARRSASDLHVATGRIPNLRLQGCLHRVETVTEPLQAGAMASLCQVLLPPALTLEEALRSSGSYDGALTSAGGARFRFNIFRRSPGYGIALRRLDDRFRSLADLGVPEQIGSWCDLPDGLVLVVGPTGSGKSTTLATLIDRINQNRSTHIVTIEDPIEYVHDSKASLVDQRQIGVDAPDFQTALVASLRQDPDVILVGEVRERDTIRTALTAAETGHLVFTTVHAPDCVGALQRISSVFPADEQPGILRQLAMNLRGILAQHLIPSDGPLANGRQGDAALHRRRILLTEVLQTSPSVANLMATGKFQQIYSCMETGAAAGMQTLEENLLGWVRAGFLSEQTALTCTRNPALLKQRLARNKTKTATGGLR